MVVKVWVVEVLHDEVDILWNIWHAPTKDRVNDVCRAVEGPGLHSVEWCSSREGRGMKRGEMVWLLFAISWPFESGGSYGVDSEWKDGPPVEGGDNKPDLTQDKKVGEPHRLSYAKQKVRDEMT